MQQRSGEGQRGEKATPECREATEDAREATEDSTSHATEESLL